MKRIVSAHIIIINMIFKKCGSKPRSIDHIFMVNIDMPMIFN